jgi:hypothetical protein
MKVSEIITPQPLHEEGVAKSLLVDLPLWAIKGARERIARFLDKDIMATIERKASADGGAEKFVKEEILDHYKSGGMFSKKVDKETLNRVNSYAEQIARERYDALHGTPIRIMRTPEEILGNKVDAVPATPATKQPVLGHDGNPILDADGRPMLKDVPGTPGKDAVPNDLLANEQTKSDIVALAEAKYRDRLMKETGTADEAAADKVIKEKTGKGNKDDTPEKDTSSDKPKKSTGATYRVWTWILRFTILLEVLNQINQAIMRPYADYLYNVRRAKMYLDSNTRPGDNSDVNPDGTVMSLDDWFDTLNRTQLLEAVKKSMQIEAQTALTLNVGSKVANQVVPDWLKWVFGGLFSMGTAGAAAAFFFKGLRTLEWNIIKVEVAVGLYIANQFAEHFSNEVQGGEANTFWNNIILWGAVQRGIVSLADITKAGIKYHPNAMATANSWIDWANSTYRDVNNNPEIIKQSQAVLNKVDAVLPTNLSGKRADQPGYNAANNIPGTSVPVKTQTNADGTVSTNIVNPDGTPAAPVTTNSSGYDNMIPNNESIDRSRWIRNYNSTKIKNPRTGLWESYKR